jgi:type I restriction enzyme S subunit
MKNIPKVRFPEFRDAPEWEENSINNLVDKDILCKPLDGNHGNIHPKSSDFVKIGIPFVMANDIKNGQINLENSHKITKKQADSLQKGFSYMDDVLLTHKGSIGQTAIVPKLDTEYIMLTPQVTYYRVKDKNKLSNKFLLHVFQSSNFQRMLDSFSGGGTRAYVGITEQRNLKINYPLLLEEQQKIAECLSSLDALILAHSSKVEALKAHKKALMQQLFPAEGETTPRLRFPEFQNDGAWEEKTLAQVSKIIMGQSPDSNAYNTLKDGKPLIQGNADIINRRTSPRIWTTESTKECQKGDIILTVRAPVGAVAKSLHDACIGRGVCAIQPNENSEFLYQFFLIQEDKWDKLSQGSTFTAINSNDIKNFKLNIPKLSEQQKIADCLSSIDELISSQSAKVEALKQHKKALMQQLFPSSKEM